MNANRSRSGIQNSSYLHLLVQEAMGPLLIVELVGSVVSASQNKLVAGLHNPSRKYYRWILDTVVVASVVVPGVRRFRGLRVCRRGAWRVTRCILRALAER